VLRLSENLEVYTPGSINLVFYEGSRHRVPFLSPSPVVHPTNAPFTVEWESIFEAYFALRCLQRLSLNAWLRGLPCRTAPELEASPRCSSRTDRSLLSNSQQHQKIESDLPHDGLNPAHVPF